MSVSFTGMLTTKLLISSHSSENSTVDTCFQSAGVQCLVDTMAAILLHLNLIHYPVEGYTIF